MLEKTVSFLNYLNWRREATTGRVTDHPDWCSVEEDGHRFWEVGEPGTVEPKPRLLARNPAPEPAPWVYRKIEVVATIAPLAGAIR